MALTKDLFPVIFPANINVKISVVSTISDQMFRLGQISVFYF